MGIHTVILFKENVVFSAGAGGQDLVRLGVWNVLFRGKCLRSERRSMCLMPLCFPSLSSTFAVLVFGSFVSWMRFSELISEESAST